MKSIFRFFLLNQLWEQPPSECYLHSLQKAYGHLSMGLHVHAHLIMSLNEPLWQ